MSVSLRYSLTAFLINKAFEQLATAVKDDSIIAETRMRNPRVLALASTNAGATVSVTGTNVVATWADARVDFMIDANGTAHATVTGHALTPQRAQQLMQSVDSAYTRVVQHEVLEKVRARAGTLGLKIEAENHDDEGNIVLSVVQVEAS